MFVNENFTVRSPIEYNDTAPCDLWTYMENGLSSADPNSVILIDHSTSGTVTIKELLVKVELIAANLLKYGFNREIPVTILMENSLEYVYIISAVWKLGGIVALLNDTSPSSDVNKCLHLLESEIMFCDDQTATFAVEGTRGTSVKNLFINGHHSGCISLKSIMYQDSPTLKDIQHSKVVNISTRDVATIIFSSGTTGLPKAVATSHFYLVQMVKVFSLPEVDFGIKTSCLVSRPLSHMFGVFLTVMAVGSGKCSIILKNMYDLKEYINCVAKYKVDKLFIAPSNAVEMTKGNYAEKCDLSHVSDIICGTAPLSDEVINELGRQLGSGLEVRQGYGMTEIIGTYCPLKKYFPTVPRNCVGLPLPGTTLKINDTETGATLGPMKQGEICLTSNIRMNGYLKNEAATAEMIDKDGWFHTGDIGYFDEVGYLFIVGRLKELIKYQGQQVPPAELENVLLSHPDIADAGVTGLPDELAGELPFAYVMLKHGRTVTAGEVHAFVNDRVTIFKQLRGGIKFVPQIPKSHNGKILRRVIRQEQLEEMNTKL